MISLISKEIDYSGSEKKTNMIYLQLTHDSRCHVREPASHLVDALLHTVLNVLHVRGRDGTTIVTSAGTLTFKRKKVKLREIFFEVRDGVKFLPGVTSVRLKYSAEEMEEEPEKREMLASVPPWNK